VGVPPDSGAWSSGVTALAGAPLREATKDTPTRGPEHRNSVRIEFMTSRMWIQLETRVASNVDTLDDDKLSRTMGNILGLSFRMVQFASQRRDGARENEEPTSVRQLDVHSAIVCHRFGWDVGDGKRSVSEAESHYGAKEVVERQSQTPNGSAAQMRGFSGW
jgi:hypothetical protein